MPVEKANPIPLGEVVEIEKIEPVLVEMEDGVEITFEDQFDPSSVGHYDNLAEYIDESDLAIVGSDVVAMYAADKQSRDRWERAYQKGLKLLGFEIEDMNEPFEGACGVFHPLLAESVVRFQSHAVMETFPASGPVKTKIVGKVTAEKSKQAARVKEDMNYMATEVMPEYRDEHERMLFNLPLAGSSFKKVYYDEKDQRPRALYVSAEDIVVSYGTTNIDDCRRLTHAMREPENELLKAIDSGFYLDPGPLGTPSPTYSETKEAEDDVSGISRSVEYDDRHLVLECHLDIDLPEPFADPKGIARPYVVTVLEDGRVLSVRRNWKEGDPNYRKRCHFSHYQYLPGMGFYGIGLIHLIGGLAKSSTSILRQLIDAGQFSNIPAGFKAKGFRTQGKDTPFRPGEWRDIDVPGDKVRDALLPLPYKEPSTVLYQLLQTVTEEGRRLGSIADVDIHDTNKETPVGTTLAIMERSLKIMSAVQSRLHKSMGRELKILADIIRTHMPVEYPFEVDEGATRAQDYDERIDIIPVSDPNASTMAQKVIQYQVAMQAAQNAPNIYDMKKLHRGMLECLAIKEAADVIPLEEDMKPMDPVAENMAILQQKPVKVFDHQDHEAHIAAHMAASQDPRILEIVGQSPNASAIQGAFMAHLVEHVAYAYRRKMEEALGTPLPDSGSPIPPDVESNLAPLIAEAGRRVLDQGKAQKKEQENKKLQEDPMIQIQLRELALKERRQQAEEKFKQEEHEIDRLKIASQERIAGARIGSDLTTKAADRQSKEKVEGVKLGINAIESASKEETKRADIRVRASAQKNSRGSE